MLSTLVGLLFSFFNVNPCPDLLPTTYPIHRVTVTEGEMITNDGRKIKSEDGIFIIGKSTTTISKITYNMKTEKIGEKLDLEAVEYNKKVIECQNKHK